MSRIRRIAECDRFFFITTNLSRNVPLLRPPEMDMLLVILDGVRQALGFQLLAYAVMPEHAHLLFVTRLETVSHIMHQWKFKSGFAVQRYRSHSGAFWQPRYFDFICRHGRDVSAKLDYIHQNPVSRKLVGKPEDWRWSSAAFYLRKGQSAIEPDHVDISGDPEELLWPAPYRNL
jgi:putative transposase